MITMPSSMPPVIVLLRMVSVSPRVRLAHFICWEARQPELHRRQWWRGRHHGLNGRLTVTVTTFIAILALTPSCIGCHRRRHGRQGVPTDVVGRATRHDGYRLGR